MSEFGFSQKTILALTNRKIFIKGTIEVPFSKQVLYSVSFNGISKNMTFVQLIKEAASK